MEETFAPSMEGHLTKDWEVLPVAVQKHIRKFVVDPNALLFRAGAHWPLLVFLGKKSRRSPEAIQRREQRAKQRAANARATRRQLGFQRASRGTERWLRLKHGWVLQRIQDDQEGEQAAAQGREAWESWWHREEWGHWGAWGQHPRTWEPSWGSGQWHLNAWQ